MIHHYINNNHVGQQIPGNTVDEKCKSAGADLLTMVKIFIERGSMSVSQPLRDDHPFISERTNGKHESFPREQVLLHHDLGGDYPIIGLSLYEVKPDFSDSPYFP